MNTENTEKLLTTYQLLYRELREFGFECGDGWFGLIWQLSADIESAARLEGIAGNSDAWPSVSVVKHKFGDLRVQFRAPVSDNIRALVEKARDISVGICELCAAPCKIIPKSEQLHWVEPLCENCLKAQHSLQ
jgi:hypothetical protein